MLIRVPRFLHQKGSKTMKSFYVDTDKKLKKIFAETEELGAAQYEEIQKQFIELICDYQEDEPGWAIDNRTSYIFSINEFLYNTKTITTKEHYELGELLNYVMDEARKMKAQEAET